jgi:hypothetical protein
MPRMRRQLSERQPLIKASRADRATEAQRPIPEVYSDGLFTQHPSVLIEPPHRANFLTFSNGAVGNGR